MKYFIVLLILFSLLFEFNSKICKKQKQLTQSKTQDMFEGQAKPWIQAQVNYSNQTISTPLTEAIEIGSPENRTHVLTKEMFEVKGLPNAPEIKSYAGFLTVDPNYNSNLFFWFFPSFKTPPKAPVIIWLEGGPGGSSLWSLFVLNGPFKVDQNLNVSLNPYSWTQEFSVLYIDNPVGTGFSYTDNEKGYSTDQSSVAHNLYMFLKQFYHIFSEYKNNELYISGESYAGKYVPAIGYKLMQMSNESGINFRGIAIGNGWTDPINQLDGLVYFKSTGLIDEKQQDEMKAIENKIRYYYNAKDFLKSGEYLRKLCK